MTKKIRPTPSGATYKQDIRLRWAGPKPDAAPNEAKRVLVDRGYKDFAPTELHRSVTNQTHSRGSFFAFLAIFLTDIALATSVAAIPTLHELCVLGRRSLPCKPNHSYKRGEVCFVVKFYGTIRI